MSEDTQNELTIGILAIIIGAGILIYILSSFTGFEFGSEDVFGEVSTDVSINQYYLGLCCKNEDYCNLNNFDKSNYICNGKDGNVNIIDLAISAAITAQVDRTNAQEVINAINKIDGFCDCYE